MLQYDISEDNKSIVIWGTFPEFEQLNNTIISLNQFWDNSPKNEPIIRFTSKITKNFTDPEYIRLQCGPTIFSPNDHDPNRTDLHHYHLYGISFDPILLSIATAYLMELSQHSHAKKSSKGYILILEDVVSAAMANYIHSSTPILDIATYATKQTPDIVLNKMMQAQKEFNRLDPESRRIRFESLMHQIANRTI